VRVLVAEDDRDLAEELREDLRAAGYAMDWAQTGTEAERLGDVEAYDAVILDLGLPERPRLDVLRHWRSHGNLVPVIHPDRPRRLAREGTGLQGRCR